MTYSQQGARAALPEFKSVLEAFRKDGDKHGEAVVTGLIGNCYKKLGDYPKALQLLNQALQMKRDLHDRLEEGKTLSHLGLVFWEQGDYSKAIEVFNQSLAIGRELQDAQLEGASLNNLSLVYEEQGDYRKSLEQYQQALELQRSVNYEPGVSDALGNIGGHYLLLGQYSTAEGYYRQAFEISDRLKLKPSQSLDLGNIAACLLGQGKIQESLATYDQAISIAREAGQAKEQADWYRGKASALLHVGRFDEALRNYQSAGETYSQAGLKRELVEDLGDTGNAYLELGDRRGAERNFLQAASISQSIGHERGIVINRLALAEVSRLSGNPSQARKSAESALVEARKVQDTAETVSGLLLLSRILQDLHQPRAALNQAKEASKIARQDKLRLAEAEALDTSGKIELELGQAEAALGDLQAARGIVEQSEDLGILWSIEYHRGQTLERLDRNDEALLAYQGAVASIEGVRNQIGEQQLRTGYLQDKQQVYVALVQLLLKMRRLGEAFGYSEQLREYSYQDLRNRSFTIKSDSNTEARSRLVQLQKLVSEESSRSGAQRRDQALQFFSEELLQAQKNYQLTLETTGYDRNAETFDATKVSGALAPRASLLEYVVARDRVVIFVVTRSGLHALSEPVSEHNLRSKVELFRELLTNGDQAAWRKPAASLYSTLILPLEQRGFLRGIQSLIIVPHGVLNYLPFAALPRSVETSSHFLIENYEIQEEPTASLLAAEGTGRSRSVERVGTFAPSSAKLKYAVPEARDVAGIFGSRGEAILGRNATKSNFQKTAPGYDIVHIATHGFFNKNNPILSGLQFEADGTDDGKLEVHDILAMRLTARLITLSACDTALGAGSYDEIPAGDEFVGLNRAFLEAGSDAVIASLWKVDDRSTDLMMRNFYGRIESTGAPSALAQTQRAMIHDPRYGSPRYWAPFIFFGREFASGAISAENE
jgi:CHAT domain-containing protein